MKSLIRNAVLMSVYHLAKQTVIRIETQMKDDKNEKEIKQQLILAGLAHSLLGIIYND